MADYERPSSADYKPKVPVKDGEQLAGGLERAADTPFVWPELLSEGDACHMRGQVPLQPDPIRDGRRARFSAATEGAKK